MTTKEWLNRGFNTFRTLQLKRARLEALGNVISRYEGREIETYHCENSSESTFLTWSETKREVEVLEAKLYVIDSETKDALRLLYNPNEYEVLYLRYITRLKWKEIEKLMNYSETHVFRLHSEGVDHVGEVAYRMIN